MSAPDSRFQFAAADTVAGILARQAGQIVELRLCSGEKIGGRVQQVGENLVHLVQLTGQEFFEAVVALEEIAAVVARSAGR